MVVLYKTIDVLPDGGPVSSEKCMYEFSVFNNITIYISNDRIYGTLILPVGLYGCKTWSLTLKEECRLMVFENRVLRVFGP
jgi:hypothetical protein